jgi:hypothetical protein
VKDDKIIISVTSKFNPSIKTTAEVIMEYNEDLTFDNSSKDWGKSAYSYKLEIKQEKHNSNGTDILSCKLTDLTGNEKPIIFKIRADQTINLNTNGQNGYTTVEEGYSFADAGPGQNAGNGGNITVVKDPSVKSYNLNYSMNGGTGGAGTAGYNRGRDGRDGNFKEEVRAVNF